MAQLSFYVTWIPAGLTGEEAVALHNGGFLMLSEEGLPLLAPSDPAPKPPAPSEATDQLLLRAAAALAAAEPSCVEDDRETEAGHLTRLVLADDQGHRIHAYPGQACVSPNHRSDGSFPRVWAYVQVLAALGPSVAELATSTGEDTVDATLGVDDARHRYGWS